MENWGVIYGENKYDFSIYSHAYCPSISRVQLALYREECAIAEAMGVGIQEFTEESFFSRSNILGSEHMGRISRSPQRTIQTGVGNRPIFHFQSLYY